MVLGACVYALWRRSEALETRLFEVEQKLIEPVVDNTPVTEAGDETPSAPESIEEVAARAATRIEPSVAKRADPDPTLSESTTETAPPLPDEIEQRQGFALPQFDFEDIFGRRLPIWAGGIALAAGGIFLVIYAIEQGLMGPTTRVALSLVFGALLLAGAEAAYRFEDRVRDPRVRQALAGAGIATLYAAGYLAGAQYGLIGPAVAFGGLALVTAGALILTHRFGLPTAVLGLVGGFATPVMVASEEANVPVLVFYLALLTAGLAISARRLGQRWLGAAGLAGGFLWGVLMLAATPVEQGDVNAIGLYLLAIGAAVPLLVGESDRLPFLRVASGVIAAIQMGALVSLAGYGLLTWGLYLLLAAALDGLAWRNADLRPAGLLVVAVGAILLGIWPEPASGDFVLVASGLGLVTLVPALALLWRRIGGLVALAQVSGGALAIGIAAWVQFGSSDNEVFLPGLAIGLAVLALAAAVAAWFAWQDAEFDEAIGLPVAASALLGFASAHVILPNWAEVLGAVGVTLCVAALLWRRPRDIGLAWLAWLGGLLALATLISTGDIFAELARAFGEREDELDLLRALIRWVAALLPFAGLALLEWRDRLLRAAEVLLALVGYVFIAQFVPGPALAWVLAFAVMALAWRLSQRTGLWATGLVLGAFWALWPLVLWVGAETNALLGQPALIGDLPTWEATLRRVLPLGIAAAVAAWRTDKNPVPYNPLALLALASLTITVHVLFKRIFAIADLDAFVALGMAERTLWLVLLIGGGFALVRLAPLSILRSAGTGLVIAGLAHFATFTLLLHNPLWSAQAVGPLPLTNLLAPAYLAAGIAVWLLSRMSDTALWGRLRQVGDAGLMLLISLWALSELRHAFAGSILSSAPMTQTEDLLRSFAGIVLALGFLWWGSRTDQRSWRIGSLVLILLAVLKVFLVDAAGLEGLLRVASFVALGASLIAIGWVYSRQLSRRGEVQTAN